MVCMDFLQAHQVSPVQDQPLQAVPDTVQVHFRPAVKHVPGGQSVHQPGHGALLQALVDGEAVDAAGNAAAPEQSHEQGRFRIALAVAVGQDLGGRKAVVGVVAE